MLMKRFPNSQDCRAGHGHSGGEDVMAWMVNPLREQIRLVAGAGVGLHRAIPENQRGQSVDEAEGVGYLKSEGEGKIDFRSEAMHGLESRHEHKRGKVGMGSVLINYLTFGIFLQR